MIHLVRLDHRKTPGNTTRLTQVLWTALEDREVVHVKDMTEFKAMAKEGTLKKILFAVHLPKNGYAPEWYEMIAYLMDNPGILKGCVAAVVINGDGSIFTKSMGRRLIFAANMAGATFPGRGLVEATGDLYNMNTVARINGVDNMTAYIDSTQNLAKRLDELNPRVIYVPDSDVLKVLAIHAGNKETSNSLMLLDMKKKEIESKCEYNEISVRNGEILDCRGCSFDECKHFGETGECFYGGLMVDQVYPAILDCDVLLMVCPNYNDAVGANITAMFNRLTALFYNNSFATKRFYGLIVSGYSGGEILAEQLIGALNCNKGFILPPNFAMIETANDPGSIKEVAGIKDRAKAFAHEILGK